MTVATATTEEVTATAPRRVRYWEIDALRGVAIIMMIIFHLLWDLWYFRVLPNIVLWDGFWKYFQRTCASLFLILVGVSLAVVTIQRMGDDLKGLPPFRPYLIRGLKIFGCGMLVTLVVWAAGVGYDDFGILHLIGFASIASYPLLRERGINLFLWAVFFVAGYLLLTPRFDFPWALQLVLHGPHLQQQLINLRLDIFNIVLGFTPRNYYPNDYFPIIPYFGVVLLGIFFGNSLYGPQGRRFFLPNYANFLPFRGLQFLGRHSLLIYLTHQLALFVILWALGIIKI